MSTEVSTLDKQLIHLLARDARLPFAAAGLMLGVSEQTIGRRYQRLVREGVLRCAAVLNPHVVEGLDSWILRITPIPGKGASLAAALTRHPAISWVNVTAEEVLCMYTAVAGEDSETMLTERLPKTSLVQSVQALHEIGRFRLQKAWPDFTDQLTPEQHGDAASTRCGTSPAIRPERVELIVDDHAILNVLNKDARAPYAMIAAATGLTRARVRARLHELVAAAAVYFELDLAVTKLGFRMVATLTAAVAPRLIHQVGERLGANPHVAYVCATNGATNIFAALVCRDRAHLYDTLTGDIGAIDGLERLELQTTLRQFKHSRTVVTNDNIRLTATSSSAARQRTRPRS